MITRTSRLYCGLGIAAYLTALFYGIITEASKTQAALDTLGGDGAVSALLGPLTFGYKGGVGEHIGYISLLALAAGFVGIGAATQAFRDGDSHAVAEVMELDAAPVVSQPYDGSPWPLAGAFGIALAVIGLAADPLFFIVGVAVIVVAGLQWLVKNWSEAATGDPVVNRAIRSRLMGPIELPIAGLAIVGFVVVFVSRAFLALSVTGAWVAALVIAAIIFAVGMVVSYRPNLSRSVIVATVLLGAVAILGLGIWGLIEGPRDFEHHGLTPEHIDLSDHVETGDTF